MDLFSLVEDLSFTNCSKLLRQILALSYTVHEYQIDHAHVRIEDSLQQDAALDALYGNLPSHLLDRDVVSYLNHQV